MLSRLLNLRVYERRVYTSVMQSRRKGSTSTPAIEMALVKCLPGSVLHIRSNLIVRPTSRVK